MKVNIYTAQSPNSKAKLYKTTQLDKAETYIRDFLEACPGGKVEIMIADGAPVAAVNKIVPFPPLHDDEQFPCERNGAFNQVLNKLAAV